MKKRFGIDIDGTVTSPSAILPFINKAFGLNITLADVKQYDLNPVVNVSEQEFANWFMNNEPRIYAGSPIAQDAASVLTKWRNQYELCFISARGPHLLDITKKWFIEQNLTFDEIELIGTHNKIESVKNYKIDLFFEDKHDNAVDITKNDIFLCSCLIRLIIKTPSQMVSFVFLIGKRLIIGSKHIA